jgi:hypothetical protein
MRKFLVRFACFAALSLAPSTVQAEVPCTAVEFIVTGTCYSWWPDIPNEPLCSDYVTAWIAMAKAAKEKRCSPGGAMWSTVVRTQGDFCLSAGTDANNARTAEMKRVMSACDACSYTVDGIMRDIVDNALYGCGFGKGFSNADGRWSTSRESQINRCVAAATTTTKAGLENYLKIAAQMSEDVRVCKLTNTNKNCVSCHSLQSSSAVQAIPKSGAAFQDPIQRLSRPNTTSTKPSNPGSPSETSNRRATPSKSSNTSAMDRLGGDSQFPDSSRPGSISGERNRRVPASGGASPVAKPIVNTPAPSPTSDFGNCASCGRAPTPPR